MSTLSHLYLTSKSYKYERPLWSLSEKLHSTTDLQEGQAILLEISRAAGRAREYGIDDQEIKTIEEAAEMLASTASEFSALLGILTEDMGQELPK